MRYTIASWIIAAILLYLALELRLVAALLAGLLVFEVVHIVAPRIPLARGRVGKVWAVALVAGIVVVALAAALFALIAFLRSDGGGLSALVQKTADILDAARNKLPPWVLESLPTDPDLLKEAVIGWFKDHAADLRGFGGEVGHVVAHVLIGMVIGAMVSLREALPAHENGPLADELIERARRVGEAFRRVVFAQVRISALNTAFTAAYLLFGLRIAGIELPFAKTLILVTFVAGLLPVVGNLISNTVILVVSLSVSLEAAIASLVFLVVIHKLEYFLNARIVGTRIHASPWELLLAMLVMEAAFGIPGLAVAPVYYAYMKDELASRGLI